MTQGRGTRIAGGAWPALAVAALYGFVGALWIGYSDQFVASLQLDPQYYTRVQQFKGWGYVAITAIGLFAILYYLFARLDRSHRTMLTKHQRLVALNRLYRMIRAVKGALLRVRESDVLLQEACRVAVVEGGYRLAWIGLRTPDGRHLRAAAHAGSGESLLDDIAIAIETIPDGAIGRALASGRAEMESTDCDPALATKGAEAARLGYRSVAALPLRVDDDVIGVLAVYGDRVDSFTNMEERNLLAEIADNLALGIGYLHRGRALDELTHYDTVTGLANRSMLEQRLTQALGRAERRGMAVAVVMVDIDEFGAINHVGGRAAGDRALQAIAQILSGAIRPGDTVARTGNDEFAVLLADLAATDLVSSPVGRIADVLPQRLHIEGHDVFLTASMGIALYPDDAATGDDLIARAELALRSQARDQRGTITYYSAELNERAQQKRRLEVALRTALDSDELGLVWQGICDAGHGQARGAEALLRWHHDALGTISPAMFIPLAEQTGLIIPIGEHVLRSACRQATDWAGDSGHPFMVSVNVALQQVLHPHFPELIREVLEEYGDDHWQLVLEITESEFMREPEVTIEACEELRSLGCAIHIDDFGTGYSALSYLARLPVDGLKIDRSFIVAAEGNAGARAVIEAVITLARRLDLVLIAEGVETRGQLAVIRELGCPLVQGYLFSHPVPAEQFEPGLPKRRRTG